MNRDWLALYSVENETDISGHLLTIYDTCISLNAQHVLELGVRYGESSKALLIALARTGGHLHAVDELRDKFDAPAFAELRAERRTFYNGHSTTVEVPDLPWDLVLIDSSHTYDVTLAELRRFERTRCFILHDWEPSRPQHGVDRAAFTFLSEQPSIWALSVRDGFNGLGVIKRRE